MAEIDWDEVQILVDDLLHALSEVSSSFCDAKYFKACLEIDGKITPIVKAWKRDVEAHKRVESLTEAYPELGEEGEEEISEMELTAEQRARLMEEEL